ncbi:unnamed protein product [Rhizophagus irregularis]|nr:unnamed protein product [Rhizophagus irregularis]
MDIVSGMRPKIISGTPSKYKALMEQCWDAGPTKRPDICTIRYKIRIILPKLDDLNLNNDSASKTTSDFKANSKALSKVFQKLRLGSGDNNQDNYGKAIVKQQIKETRC